MFELFSFRNPVVIVPKDENILLHGVRNLDTFREEEPEIPASKYGWNLVPGIKNYYFIQFQVSTKNFKSLEDVVASAKKLDPGRYTIKLKMLKIRSEGFVVRDGNFNRVKVKSPQYVCMSLMSWKDKDGLNKRRMLEIVRSNEGATFK